MLTYPELYSWVRDLPIVDWHNHLDLKMLAEDRPLGSLYEVWVQADPYKHRAMRICGESEDVITGFSGQRVSTSVDSEAAKWAAWMRTLPKLVGNPIFAWAKMELEFLGLDPEPYLHGQGENVSLGDWTPSKMLKAFNVETICPCLGAEQLGQRASRPLPAPVLGQRASRPLVWTAPRMWILPGAEGDTSAHFSHSLISEDFHRRNLPHVGQNGTLVFVTFRLGDSLPAVKLAELETLRRQVRQPGAGSNLTREEIEKIDAWLDAGYGSCLLANEKCRQIVEDALTYFDAGNQRASRTGPTGVPPVGASSSASLNNGQDARCPGDGVPPVAVKSRYRLHAYVVMPNHVHVLFELFDAADLANVLHSWKSYTAKAIDRELGLTGVLWREEYYDRLIRDGQHYRNVISYLRKNERAAKTIADVNGQDARFPSECCPGDDAVLTVPSLRMNAGERIANETLKRFEAAGCRVVDISVDDTAKLDKEYDAIAAVAAFVVAHGWTMLLHLGALRETSARLRAAAGPVGGFAGMRAPVDPVDVARFMDRLESRPFPALPRTILLSLNPEAHAQLAVLAGSFNGAGMPGKIQLGPAWWWCDHAEGIRDVLEKNAAYGVLSTFVGMTTDSRSLLSFVRHDYFRRLFCRWVAEKVASGDFPDDEALLRPMMENVCYRNARALFT